MTLIGCPFFHCNYCNYCNWSVLSVMIKLWLSNTKNMYDSHCFHKTSSNSPVSESMINPRTTISFGTRG